MEGRRIAIIGSGNVATHLARAFNHLCHVTQIVSRHIDNAKVLAESLHNATYHDDPTDINPDTDLCLISVNDNSISQVASSLPKIRGIVAHTSGSTDITVLNSVNGHKGVFYPLQTFSKHIPVDIRDVPFFVEGDNSVTQQELIGYASLLSRNVYEADSHQRAILHIAAVFGCNFTNHLLHIARKILADGGYPLEVLQPLLQETVRKAFATDPYDAQTGPAVRGDSLIISKHISTLGANTDNAKLYSMLTDSIYNAHHTDITERNK